VKELEDLKVKMPNPNTSEPNSIETTRKWKNRKNEKYLEKRFFVATFLIGLVVTFSLGGGAFVFYRFAPTYFLQPNYQGFAIAHNYTHNFLANFISISVFVLSQMPELSFRYYFSVEQNGTYNFIFIFPFKFFENINSTEGMNFNLTSYGTAVWLEYQVTNVSRNGKSDYVWGNFWIANTFQSGTRGDYVFSLPFFGGVGSSNITEELQDRLNVAWHSPAGRVMLEFVVPSRFQITQAYPQVFSEPSDTLKFSGNRTVNSVNWNLGWLDQQFTIFCSDGQESSSYESVLFFSGLFLSIGASIMVESAYDASKKRIFSKNISKQK